ncbi:MAG: hypothetical protein EOM26_12305 [Alphaproteobacteria bacterium]|nr:hypothetical protein [Alphaproteobacteria bacterium]
MQRNWAAIRVYTVLVVFWLFLSFAVWFGMETFLFFSADGGVSGSPSRTGLELWLTRLTFPLTLVVFGIVIFWRKKELADDLHQEDEEFPAAFGDESEDR